MVNLNEGLEIDNKFLGSEVKKTIIYKDAIYMVKFPDPVRKTDNPLSYMNNQFSEHMGCLIFKECGFETQDTFLGTYTDKKGNEKTVVACRDFTQDGSVLYEFSKYGLSYDDTDGKISTTMEDVQLIIQSNDRIKNKGEIINKFWDMFVIDALIGNSDRHLNNWGFLKKEGALRFAPIYDCGSTLSPLISEQKMKEMLSNYIEFKEKEFNVFSCYTMDGKRIFYHEIFKKPPKELISAIKRTVPKINMQKIHDIVNNTEGVSSVRKEYLTKALDMRYEKILAPALKRVLKGELNSNKKEIDKEPLSGSEWDKMINENMKKSCTDQSQGLQNISYDKQMKVHSDEGKGR